MLAVSWIAIFIKDLLFERKVYDLIFSFGQAIVPFTFAAIVIFLGYILQWIEKPKWPIVMKVAWIVFLLAIFFIYYGEISLG